MFMRTDFWSVVLSTLVATAFLLYVLALVARGAVRTRAMRSRS